MASKTKAKGSKNSGTLADCKALHAAVEEFVRANNQFESSFVVNEALDEMSKTRTFVELFDLPMRHKLFGLDNALLWILFLALAPDRAAKDGDTTTLSDAFSANIALGRIKDIYDVGVQTAVYEHFEADESDDEEEENEDDDSPGKHKKKGQ